MKKIFPQSKVNILPYKSFAGLWNHGLTDQIHVSHILFGVILPWINDCNISLYLFGNKKILKCQIIFLFSTFTYFLSLFHNT